MPLESIGKYLPLDHTLLAIYHCIKQSLAQHCLFPVFSKSLTPWLYANYEEFEFIDARILYSVGTF